MKKRYLFLIPMLFGVTLTGCSQEISKADLNKALVGKQSTANLHKEEYKGVEVKGETYITIDAKTEDGSTKETHGEIRNNFVARTNSVTASEYTSKNTVHEKVVDKDGKVNEAKANASVSYYRVVEENSIKVANIVEGKVETTNQEAKVESFSNLTTLTNKGDANYKESLEVIKTTALDYLNQGITSFLSFVNMPIEDIKLTAQDIFGNEVYETKLEGNLNDLATLSLTAQVKFKENYLNHFEVKFNSQVNSKDGKNSGNFKFGIVLDINKYDKEIKIPEREYTVTTAVEVNHYSPKDTVDVAKDAFAK